ncbi:MAG: glycosyltransferase, partial [Microvirga sp.]
VPRYEPFGLAVLEAAQAGCALVLSDIPTLRELWDGAALFVAADDDAAIAAAIRDLVADPRRRARLGVAARARSEIYTVESTAQGMMAIYEAVLARQAAFRHEAVA